MTAKTQLLAKSGACVAILNYDDAILLATGVTVANIGGHETVIFTIVIDQTYTATVPVGQTVAITFTAPVALTLPLLSSGVTGLVLSGLISFSIGNV